MSQPICRHCAAGVQLFKWCRNLSAGTVLQGCSCLNGVLTYLPALCCRVAAAKVVMKPICQDCVAEVQLFKQCRNLSARTVLQGCSCFSGVETYLPGLCCRGAAVEVVLIPICWDCVAEVQLFKWCRNLSAWTVLQGCSCLSDVKTYLLGLCCRGAAV